MQAPSAILTLMVQGQSPIEMPSFWAGFALVEVALPMVVPNRRWAGIAMLVAGTILILVSFGWSPSPLIPIPSAPAPTVGVPAAVAIAVMGAIAQRLFADWSLRRDALQLADEIKEFAAIAHAKIPRVISSLTWHSETSHIRADYVKQFHSRIARIAKPLFERWPELDEARGSLLGEKPADGLPQMEWASKFLTRRAEALPAPKLWFNRHLISAGASFLILTFGFWLAWWAVSHK